MGQMGGCETGGERMNQQEEQQLLGCTAAATRDRISELPDDVLVQILTLLDTKDAVRTSILSRQWRQRWMLRHDLNFDQLNMFSQEDIIRNLDPYRDYQSFEKHRDNFLQRVDDYIHQRQQHQADKSSIRSLEVCFLLGAEPFSSTCLNRWTQLAIEQGAEKMELLLSHSSYLDFNSNPPKDATYTFPLGRLSKTRSTATLKHLYLQTCCINTYRPEDFGILKGLTFLKLERVYVEANFTEGLFSACTKLKELVFESCYFSPNQQLNVVSSSLTCLRVFHFSNGGNISISAPNLTSLYIGGRVGKVSSLDAPSLLRCSYQRSIVRHDNDFSQLTGPPRLEDLTMVIYPMAVAKTMLAKTVPVSKDASFASLKRLALQFSSRKCVDIGWISAVLKASPQLKNLEFMFPIKEPEGAEERVFAGWSWMKNPVVEFTHNKLAKVEISGCDGTAEEIELVLLLFRTAVNLERIKVTPVVNYLSFSEERCIMKGGDHSSWYSSKREIVRGMLQGQVPHGVQLILA